MTLRRLRQLVVLLLLGAIVNVAVAWGAASLFSRAWIDAALIAELNQTYLDTAKEAFAKDPSAEVPMPFVAARSMFRDIAKYSYRKHPPSAISVLIDKHHCGYPYRCLSGVRTEYQDFGTFVNGMPSRRVPVSTTTFDGATPLNGVIQICQGHDNFAVESAQLLMLFDPIWPGFAINTFFYAAILWVLFAVPLALRRRRRIKRGQCPACAYPVGTSPVCTECGKPLKFRKGMGLPPPATPHPKIDDT